MLRLSDDAMVLAATDLTNHLACGHLSQQRLAIARDERSRPRPAEDPHAELIRTRGDRHEREQLELLSDACGGHVDLSEDRMPRTRVELLDSAARTADAMQAGEPLIYQGQLFDGQWQGRADFLRRVAIPSALGDYAYELLDTKLARHVAPYVVHQLSLYNRLVTTIQGVDVGVAHVVLGNGEHVPIELGRYAALHRRVTSQYAAVVAAPTTPTYPEPVAHCGICALADECHARLVDDDHLSLVAGARRDQRERLVAAEIGTVLELAEEPLDRDVPGLVADRFALLRHQAGLQVLSRRTRQPAHRHLPAAQAAGYARLPPPSAGDVFFDLEGDPYVGDGGIEYLWGWWSEEGGYECTWAHDVAGEKAAFEHFVDRMVVMRQRHPDMHVFHYAPHELSKLRSLSVQHATREEEVDDLLRAEVLVDLYAVVKHAMQVGEDSYSLKKLERHHGFERLEKRVREGGGSIVAYETWLEIGEDEILESIRAYNEEDCLSTLSLRDWLLEVMRPEAEAELGVDFEDFRKPEPDQERSAPDWMPATLGLVDRLTAGLPADPGEDTPDQAERRLLSHLLLYHHREAKPSWWRYFDLCGKTVAELVDERDALAGLVLDESRPPTSYKRSLDYAFTFPAQEFRLDTGDAQDPTTGDNHNIVHLDDDLVVLRRGASKPPPAPAALITGSPINVTVLRGALVELAQALLDADGRFELSRRLLRREPPRLASGTLGEDVDSLNAATLALDGAALPVQGPPGTGKTYRGARMIVAALAEGRRVAITAPSHAAVRNLLREVETHAAATGFAFEGVYKGVVDYDSPTGFVEFVSNNAGVTTDFQLAAGTAWLFAREEHRRAFDLIVIDEAGQFSLANAAAVGMAATTCVLLGDPQQLPQVTQAEHPGGSGASVLEHLLDGASTISPERGVLLTETWRMHPGVCGFVSECSYDGKLHSRTGCELRRIDAPGALNGAGLRHLTVEHEGRSQASPEEAEAIASACLDLLEGGQVVDADGVVRRLTASDILIVAPYNLAVRMIRDRVPIGVRVGTVDSFQGQEAPVVFYAMTCSSGEDVPRGLDFLFDANRLNVAVSRAQCLAVLVYSPRLLDANCATLEAMELVDGVCRFVELAGDSPPS